jgi:hypothetical protein
MADPFRVLVTGSRSWPSQDQVWAALDSVLARAGKPVLVIHGACPQGADKFAAEWVWANRRLPWPGVSQERHPADWRHRGSGLERNESMVALGADLCLAFIAPCRGRRCRYASPHGSHGASHCAAVAEKAGIPVRRYGWGEDPSLTHW